MTSCDASAENGANVSVAVHLSGGIDVRLLEGDGFRRTQLCKLGPEVQDLLEE
jgi:hypothetical protein